MSFTYALPQRPPNRGASNDPPPPTLPPRPGKSVKPPPPVAAQSDSDGDSDSNYVDPQVDDDKPPPLPPHPQMLEDNDEDEPGLIYDDCEEPGEIYDDFEEDTAPKLPERPKLPTPLPASPEITYDDISNSSGPIVQHIPKKGRSLPQPPTIRPVPQPPPSSGKQVEVFEDVYEDPEGSQMPPPSPGSEENVYEVDDLGKSTAAPTAPSVPLLPPKDSSRAPKPPPQPKSSPGSMGGVPAQSQGVNLTELLNKKKGLRNVSTDSPPEQLIVKHEPKMYNDNTNASFQARFQKFEEKDKGSGHGKPGVSPKPAAIVPKLKPVPQSARSQSNSTSSAAKTGSLSVGPKTIHSSSSAVSSVPDVLFIQKANQEKQSNVPLQHSNAPLLPIPAMPSKPVIKFVPPTPSTGDTDMEEIYDDATSAALLDRYDWYHGDLSRSEGEKRVNYVNKDGAYLVRLSKKDYQFPYTLVVLHCGHINNLRIRRRADGKVALGDEKPDEMAFTDVVAMINHHKNNNVLLLGNNQATVKLQQPAPKK